MKTIFLHFLLFLFPGIGYSSVVFVDINPDTSLPVPMYNGTDSIALDLDNNGVEDFTFKASRIGSFIGTIAVYANTNNAVLVDNIVNQNALALNSGLTIGINSAGSWSDTAQLYTYMMATVGGLWNNGKDNYLAFRFADLQGINHYGWMKLSVDSSSFSVTIKEYSYETDDEQSLSTPLVGVDDSYFYDKSIYVINNRMNSTLTCMFRDDVKINKMELFDLQGKVIITNFQGERNSVTISTTGITLGVYLIKIQGDQLIHSEKIFFY